MLLDVDNLAGPSRPTVSSNKHRDEDQVLLDTRRSFVVYPRGEANLLPKLKAGIPQESKKMMQEQLFEVIVGVLRKYPRLSYFQVRLARLN